jgi:glycosyltransferase involved in cell wall biosynthesis
LNSELRSLRIGIDGRAFASPAGGIRRYVTKLVAAVQALDGGVEFVALGGHAETIPSGLERSGEPMHPPTNAGWAVIGLPRAAARARVELIHAPAYTGPFWAGVPVVLTVHDVSYALHPEWYPNRIGPARQWFYRQSARSAVRILTVSEFSASEIVTAYGTPKRSITVAPLGVDEFFTPSDPDVPNDLPADVAEPFLLHVGDLHERRNLSVVIEALAEARRHFGSVAALSLVLAGIDRGVSGALCRLAEDAGIGDAVVSLGAVSDERLRALYRGAAALVYPSLYEGFGLPLLEAMACGTPVIASRNASIPEVVGDAGVLLDPTDVGQWVEAIMNDGALRARLTAAGLRRAASFTWEQTARITLDAYREAASA